MTYLPGNWREEFDRKVSVVESGLTGSGGVSLKTSAFEGSKKILQVALRRVQETRRDLSDYVLAAEKILKTAFYGEGFLLLVDADTEWHRVPDPMRGREVFSPGEAARYFGTDRAILGMLIDMPLGDNLSGIGSSAGWFAVTLRRTPTVRAFKDTVLHEVGHVFSLSHCPHPGCVMAKRERRGLSDGYCESCTRSLRAEAEKRAVTPGG